MKSFSLKSVFALAALAGLAGTANADILSATNSTFGSFDESSGTRTFSLTGGTVGDVDIWIDFAKCDDPALTSGSTCQGPGSSFSREIVLRLTDAHGHTVNLVNQDSYSGQTPGARIQVNFDDEAASTVGGPALLSGAFRPVSPLSAFDGFDAAGIWTLFIQDTVEFDPLSFFSARLTVTTVPEPATLALFGLGLLGAGVARRARRK